VTRADGLRHLRVLLVSVGLSVGFVVATLVANYLEVKR